MDVVASTLQWQRWLLVAALVGSAVVILPAAVEPVMLPKMTLLLALALASMACFAARSAWTRRVHLPVVPAAIAAAVVVAALGLATIASPLPLASTIGFLGRYTGLVGYLVYVVLFLTALSAVDVRFARTLTRAALVALGCVVAYGLLQVAGLDPAGFEDEGLGTSFSFLGNTNFAGAWTGAVCGLALTMAGDSREPRAWRAYASGLLPLSLLYAALTTTSQGPVVALVSMAVAGLALVTQRGGAAQDLWQRRRPVVLTVAGVALATLVGAVTLSFGFLRTQLDQALVERPDFWAAAVRIWQDHPFVGSGLDTFAHNFLAYRPVGHALANGAASADAPHNVALGMFANGGLVLGLAYLAFVLAVGWCLILGLRHCEPSARAVLGGWGAVWAGYQVQALVSFDVPPLAVLHWLSAAVIVALAAPVRYRAISLPGRPVETLRAKKGRPATVVVPASTKAAVAGSVAAALGLLWLGLYPLRADLVAAQAAPLTAAGRFADAVPVFERATRLNPSEPSYPYLLARTHDALQQPALAYDAAVEAAERDTGTVQYALFAARQAQAMAEAPQALRWFADAVERDPKNPAVLLEAARFAQEVGDTAFVRSLAEQTLRAQPDNPEAQVLLEQVS